jgi:hypothetical protein
MKGHNMNYQNPSIKSEKLQLGTVSGQYTLLVTPDCPSYFQRGLIIEDGNGIFCAPDEVPGDVNASATLICSNIDGEFILTVGNVTPGGGLTCPDGQTSFVQSYTSNVPEDCVIDQVLFTLGNEVADLCELVG